jgi:hypothetical protein
MKCETYYSGTERVEMVRLLKQVLKSLKSATISFKRNPPGFGQRKSLT